jgi:hypothetical protein
VNDLNRPVQPKLGFCEGLIDNGTISALLTHDEAFADELAPGDLGLPREIDVLVMTALAKNPAERQPTMERLGEDVAGVHAMLGGGGSAPRSGLMSAPQAAMPMPSMGGHQTPLPRPSGPPPGVPRTFPPGMMQQVPSNAPGMQPAQPSSMPPMAAHAPMSAPPMQGPMQGPTPVPPMQTPPAYAMQPAKKSKAPLIAVIVVLLLAGGGAAAFFATRGTSGGAGSASGSADPDDPWAGSGGGGGGGGGGVAPAPPPAPVAQWGSYADASIGWSLKLPPGVATSPVMNNGSYNFSGYRDGAMITVGAYGSPNTGANPSRSELEEFGKQLASQLGARVTESGYVETQGKNRFRVVMETGTEHGEARFYIEPHVVVMAYYTRTSGWDENASERREFFEGVSLPAGAM